MENLFASRELAGVAPAASGLKFLHHMWYAPLKVHPDGKDVADLTTGLLLSPLRRPLPVGLENIFVKQFWRLLLSLSLTACVHAQDKPAGMVWLPGGTFAMGSVDPLSRPD